jgi:serine/threonine protein kinase
MNEKSILSTLNHPFLVRLKECFQDEKKLYFVLEYCPGGELFGLLSLKDKLSEEQYIPYHVEPSFILPKSSLLLMPFINEILYTESTFTFI